MTRPARFFRMLSALLVLTIAVPVLAGCSPGGTGGTTVATAQAPLQVGMELAYPPFETKNEKGDPTGISVEIAKAFGAYLGRPVEIQNIAWDGLIPSLETGKVDMIISSMTITEKRRETVDFSDPYAWAYLALLVNTNSGIAKAADFNQSGMVLAAKKGTSAVDFTQKNYPLVEIRQLSDVVACVTEVSQDKADAFMYDQLSIYQNYLQFPKNTKVIYIPGQQAEAWGAAFKKGNTDLVTKMNLFIAKYRSEGGFDKLGDQFLSAEKAFFRDNGLKFFFEKP
jgi:polar amino acid transport system substrate-binding protein